MYLIPHISIEQYGAIQKHRGFLNIDHKTMNLCIDEENQKHASSQTVTAVQQAYPHHRYQTATAPEFTESIPSYTPTPVPTFSSGGGGDFGGGGSSGCWSDSSSDSGSSDSGSSSSD
jgi:hypothetical protein